MEFLSLGGAFAGRSWSVSCALAQCLFSSKLLGGLSALRPHRRDRDQHPPCRARHPLAPRQRTTKRLGDMRALRHIVEPRLTTFCPDRRLALRTHATPPFPQSPDTLAIHARYTRAFTIHHRPHASTIHLPSRVATSSDECQSRRPTVGARPSAFEAGELVGAFGAYSVHFAGRCIHSLECARITLAKYRLCESKDL
jgi:hypothetical protein